MLENMFQVKSRAFKVFFRPTLEQLELLDFA